MLLVEHIIAILHVIVKLFSTYVTRARFQIVNKLSKLFLGASLVGRFLKHCSLQVFNIGGNLIGDDGIMSIMEGVEQNKTLTKLMVHRCGLTARGFKLYTVIVG